MAWNTEGTRALGLRGSASLPFTVKQGLVTSFNSPNYDTWERQLVEFAESVDSAGYAAACTGDGETLTGAAGNTRTTSCGRYLAGLESDFAKSLTG